MEVSHFGVQILNSLEISVKDRRLQVHKDNKLISDQGDGEIAHTN